MKDVEHDKPRQASGGGWLGWLRAVWPRGPPQLVLLDTGMIAELSQSDQRSLISFFKALTKQDGESLGNAILNMSERYTCKVSKAILAWHETFWFLARRSFPAKHSHHSTHVASWGPM